MSNNTEFKWTVDLLAEFIKDYSDKEGTAADLMEQFKESKQPKPEWEILSYLSSTHPDRYIIDQNHLNWNYAVAKDMDIHSVKRLSDGEVFTIGDKVKFDEKQHNILGFKKEAGCMMIKYHSSSFLNIMYVEKEKPIIFTSEDGIAIYKDYSGKISTVYEDFSFNYDCPMRQILSEQEENYPFTIKYFSTKEAAREFIINNKPLFSLKEIRTIGNVGENNPYYKKLVALAESKLK